MLLIPEHRRTRRGVPAWPLWALLAGCIDYTPAKVGDEREPAAADSVSDDDTGSVDSSPDDTSDESAAPRAEACNGEDDDADGEIDEGFGDVDADGVADCVDGACSTASNSASDTWMETTCTAPVFAPADPWAFEILWEFSYPNGGCQVHGVADLDGNGTSDVLCMTKHDLYALDGATGAVLWTNALFDGLSPIAIADLDADGGIDIVGLAADRTVVALDASGGFKWASTAELGSSWAGTGWAEVKRISIQVSDLDADGIPEVLTHHGAVSGLDGTLVARFNTADDQRHLAECEIAVGDLDGDGRQDVLDYWTRYDASGAVVWSIPPADDLTMSMPLLVQADADEDAEIAWLADTEMLVLDADGGEIARAPVSTRLISIACAGDLDGDGSMEVIGENEDALKVWGLDGTLHWERAKDDLTGSYTGCTTFDFDGDGRREIIASDMYDFFILDADGALLFDDPTWHSVTVGDLPLVVDTDGDGSVEIILTSPTDAADAWPLRVYTNRHRDLPPGTPFWSGANWSGTGLLGDGTVPRTPRAPWREYGAWRAQPESWISGADLAPEVTSSCVASCEGGDALLAVAVHDLGPDEVATGVSVAVYTLDSVGNRTLKDVYRMTEFLDDGTRSATFEVRVTLQEATDGVVIVAGDDGTGVRTIDCDLSNNEITWRQTECPP